MKSKSLLAALLVLVTVSVSAKEVTKPTSQIPERREFPLNEKINPCEDFHAYVCSQAESSFKLRSDRSRHLFAFDDSSERLLEKKKEYFQKFASLKGLDERTQQIQDVYNSCMNVSEKIKAEKSEVNALFKEVNNINDIDSLIQYQIDNQGPLDTLYGYYANQNPNEPKKLDVLLMANLMRLHDHKYYDDAKLVQDYENIIVAFLKLIDPKAKDLKERARNIVNLEKDFIKTYPVASVRRSRWSEDHTEAMADVIKKYPKLKLAQLFKLAPPTAKVSAPIPESLDFIEAALSKYPLQTWKDNFLYDNLSEIIDDSNPKYFKMTFDFNKKYFGGPVERSPRQERCTDLASGEFYKEFDSHFLNQVFPQFNEKPVFEIGQKIRESILAGLKANTWLTASAKEAAIKKISTARLQLVKPQNDREWDFLPVKKYSPTNLIENLKLHKVASFEKTNTELKEPANIDAWGMGPLTVNAYYSGSENKFVLPIGILQYPFYDEKGLLYENLGAVGSVFAHETGHGIDDQGSKYDATGKLDPWMKDKDLTEFTRRNSKLVDQFNKAKHDGKLTLGENTADLVGVTFSFNAAFPESVRKNPSEKDLQEFRNFFVSFGRLWCESVRPDFDKLARKTNPHSSGIARVNEQVKQQAAFAKAYSCKPGDAMTLPEADRVQIW